MGNYHGGAASPLIAEHHEHVIECGMTLRDYFAAKAMQSIYLRLGGSPMACNRDGTLDMTASHAYQMADAMIAERGK